MIDRSLVLIVLVSIQCIQSNEFINTMEPDIQSQEYNNTEKQSNQSQGLSSQQGSIYDCPKPPKPAPPFFTAGRTMCRNNHFCGTHDNTPFSWCYTDFSDNWDYCCTGECNYYGYDYLWCKSGIRWQYCGSCLKKDVKGRQCLATFPCGLHLELGGKEDRYYWCYVDLDKNWEYCCAPHSQCAQRGYKYFWCLISGEKSRDIYRKCVP
ncbi:hypothetical protein ACJMK2_021372 [Sinanodonta woodiana]|uniref:Uncharacterized protein n=1 Tax=Sinanodonta woodiana TaxID=1069815 RepID=A0ABD3TFX2_SINWO